LFVLLTAGRQTVESASNLHETEGVSSASLPVLPTITSAWFTFMQQCIAMFIIISLLISLYSGVQI